MNIVKPTESQGKICSDLIRLRKKLGGLEAKRVAGVPYAVKSAKDLMTKVREVADELGMIMCGSPVDVILNYETTERGTKVHVNGTYRFMSSDGTYVDFEGVGSGLATDDKAAGKASTYAWKECIVKALSLPDAEMVDTDDEELLPHVFDLLAEIEKCKKLTELKALRPKLDMLKDHEKTAVMPHYIRMNGELKNT